MLPRSKNHKRFVVTLIATTLALVLMHLLVTFWSTVLGHESSIAITDTISFDPAWWFHLDREKKFGSIFNTLLIIIAAVLTVRAGSLVRSRKMMTLGWALLACILFYMACDEFFSIHEFAGQHAGIDSPMGTTVIPDWVQVMALVVLLLIIPLSMFWWKLPVWLRVRTAIAGAVYLGGAMGGEIAASTFVMHNGFENFTYNCLSALEEGMEMFGMIILIDALLLHLTRTPDAVAAAKETEPAQPPAIETA